MIRAIGLFLLLVVGVALTGCGGTLLTPKTGPGTPYPCGYFGTSCYPFDGTHTCCRLEHYVCIKDGCDYTGNPDTLGPTLARRVARTSE
jgi:uncharacterized protein YceK